MTAAGRLDYIRKIIKEEGKAKVNELSIACNVTEETIRKDLDKLEEEGFLLRVHGGAVLNQNIAESSTTPSELDNSRYGIRKNINRSAKQIIAQTAMGIMSSEATMFVDSSTTAAEVVSALPVNADLTIVTNSTQFFGEYYNNNFNIISTGGEFNSKYLCLQGAITKETIEKYNVDVALIGCKAIDLENGIQDSYDEEAEIKKLMISRAQKVILLADHSKFNQTAFVKLLDLDAVDYLITDRDPGEEWRNICKENNITLYF